MTVGHETDVTGTIVDTACTVLTEAGILRSEGFPRFDPASFRAAQKKIEPNFTVPQTTISPLMRRFLFHLGYGARPGHIYAAGSYVGFAFAWMVAGRAERDVDFSARGVDIDANATAIADRNLSYLICGADVGVATTDAVQDLQMSGPSIDMLFIDVDSPEGRKVAYLDILERAVPRMPAGALVLAHDPLVPVFAGDFRKYFQYIEAEPRFGPTNTLPLDDCGISVTVTR